MQRPDLTDAVAVVTGASSGIGVELARSLVERGVGRVWLVARRADKLSALADTLGEPARVLAADLSDEAGCRALVEAIPRVDILVNNAGVLYPGLVEAVASRDPDALVRTVEVNCRAVVRLTTAWYPGMVERGFGWVLNVGSVNGDFPTPISATYSASKAFINTFTEALHMEAAGTGVEVHLLAPGPVRTIMLDQLDDVGFGMPGPLIVEARDCAREGLDRLFAGRARTTPGVLTRVGTAIPAALPRWMLRRIMRPAVPLYRRALNRASAD